VGNGAYGGPDLYFLMVMPAAEKTIDPLQQLPRGRHGLPREQVTQSQRTRILRAMIAAVAERGYPETRVVDVISVAGVSRKTFYELFSDKEECFLAAYDYIVGRLFGETAQAYESHSDKPWADRIRVGLARLLTMMAENPEAARFSIIEVLAAGPKAVTRRDAAMRQFTHFVDAGRAESELELPGITSLAIVGGLYELIYSEILHGATAQLPSRHPELAYWVTQPFLGPKRAAEVREAARNSDDLEPAPKI